MGQGQGGGRPRKFETAMQIEALADAYFLEAEAKKRPFTITGLAIALGTSRSALIDYEGGKHDTETERFSEGNKWQKLRVENYAEEQLYLSPKTAEPIFHLMNMGWKNRTQKDLNGPDGGSILISEEFRKTYEGFSKSF